MSVVDRVALAAAEAAGRNLSPRAGLTALRSLLPSLSDADHRRRALVGMLDHAITLRDDSALEWILGRWSVESTDMFSAAVNVVRRLVKQRRSETARKVASAECDREASGRAFYLRARCTRDADNAAADLRLALRKASQAPRDETLALAAAARLARVSLEKPKPAIDLEQLDERARLAVLTAMLHAKGRYGRVAALDGIVTLAQSKDPDVAKAAVRLAVRHADSDGRLTEIEIDRIRTAVAHWPDEATRAEAMRRLEQRRAMVAGEVSEHAVAQQVLDGGEVQSRIADSAFRALDAIVALRKGKSDRADRLEALVATVDAERPRISMPLLTAAWLACADGSSDARGAGARLAKRLIQLPGPRPSRGWKRLSERVEDPKLAGELLAVAAEVHEPGAIESLCEVDVRAAWTAYAKGERTEARRLLRAAQSKATR